ncbi:type 3 dihydrofolate reductase [Aeromonas veronii]|uniref:type 3 dihydrofolate reductase n=1 Tax=Aeromonas veronii TaxID=654 RepID=UPI0011171BE0|nr:type 3 dihydrofolate reductase [Aeromonas veronii]TNI30620.1 diacylglycerol kinase [Aeromonas veronii]
MKISMIAALAKKQVIGKNNLMPWHMPADLAHFKRVTLGKPVLMGRKTFESIGRPLPGRRNLVISRNPGYQAEGIEVVSSVEAALALLAGSSVEELMVIGGGHLYAEMLPSADCLYLTRIDLAVEGDTRFPAFDDGQWQRIACESHPADEKNPHPYSFEIWQRR